MSGLVLNLRPHETFLVGPHVLQNGPKKAQIHVRDDRAGVLRLSDALHPDQVTTPLTRIYYAAQLLLLEPQADESDRGVLMALLADARTALPRAQALREAEAAAEEGRYYQALRSLRPLLPAEALLLSQDQIREDGDLKLCMDIAC